MSSDDTTKQLPTEDKLDSLISLVRQLASDMADVKTRLTSVEQDVKDVKARVVTLEQTVEKRLYDTRPIWEAVQAQINQLSDEVQKGFYMFDRRLETLSGDMINLRTGLRLLEDRVEKLDKQPT